MAVRMLRTQTEVSSHLSLLGEKAREAACTSRGVSMSERRPQVFTAAMAPEQRCWCWAEGLGGRQKQKYSLAECSPKCSAEPKCEEETVLPAEWVQWRPGGPVTLTLLNTPPPDTVGCATPEAAGLPESSPRQLSSDPGAFGNQNHSVLHTEGKEQSRKLGKESGVGGGGIWEHLGDPWFCWFCCDMAQEACGSWKRTFG